MKTQTKTITPEWASEILEKHNTRNRKISESVVEGYANDMKCGRWVLTHQGIALFENGDLADGQHRLAAVVASGKSVEMMVTTDMPDKRNGLGVKTQDVIDGNRPRSVASQLQLCHGYTNTNRLSALVTGIAKLATTGEVKVNTVKTIAILSLLERSIEAVTEVFYLNPKSWNSRVAAPVVIYHTVNPDKAMDFANKFCTHENCASGDPALGLYRVMQDRNLGMINCFKSNALPRITATALWHHNEGTPIKRLREHADAIKWFFELNPALIKRIRSEMGYKG